MLPFAVVATAVAMFLGLVVVALRLKFLPLHKLIVVLDLDECLVYVNKSGIITDDTNGIESFVCALGLGNGKKECQVFLRPGWKELLTFLSQHPDRYEVHIFTASESDYAQPVLQGLERRINGGNCKRTDPLFTQCWFRESCRTRIFLNHPFIFKDLSVLLDKHNNNRQGTILQLNRMVLLDDDPTNFSDNPEHGIPIRPWQGNDPWDGSLNKVLRLLQELEKVRDVRPILEQKFGIGTAFRAARKKYPTSVPHQWEYVTNAVQTVQM